MATHSSEDAEVTVETPTVISKFGSERSWHLAFLFIMTVTVVAFTAWAIGYIHHTSMVMVLLTASALGIFMAFNIGGNDVANSFGTSVGAGTLSMKQALLVAALFEVSGAVLAGGHVTETVRSSIVDLNQLTPDPMDFVFIMMAALLGAACWLLVATKFGLPVSTTHSIIGAIVGASLTLGWITGTGSLQMVRWDTIGSIAFSWVLSPVLGGITAYVLFTLIQRHVLLYNEKAESKLREINRELLEHRDRHRNEFSRLTQLQQISYTNKLMRDSELARRPDIDPSQLESDYFKELKRIDKRVDEVHAHRALMTWVPTLGAFGAVVIVSMLLLKGLSNLKLGLTPLALILILAMVAMAVWMALFMFANTLRGKQLSKATFSLFSWMQVFTAATFAFSHGANDISNAVGPFAAVLDVLRTKAISPTAAVPTPLIITFGISLVVGLWFIGRAVIRTVGEGLTKIHPASGFAAELSAAMVVLAASLLGLPVSSTHILIGAVLGVGLVNRAANWKMMRPIGLAWLITLPVAGLIGALGLVVLRAIFG